MRLDSDDISHDSVIETVFYVTKAQTGHIVCQPCFWPGVSDSVLETGG